jgi:hypothetical protein
MKRIVDLDRLIELTRAISEEISSSEGFSETPSSRQIFDACLYLRHDLGLMSSEDREKAMYSMKEHWIAIWKACHQQRG